MGTTIAPTMASTRSTTVDEINSICHHQGGPNQQHSLCQTISNAMCECTDNVIKENYVCKIFALLISLYVNSRLNGFHKLIFFKIIIFVNIQGNVL